MKRIFVALFTASIVLGFSAPTHAASAQENRQHIQQVVESFRAALINKDQTAFMKLFLKPDIPWIGVLTDKSLARIITSKPDPNMPDPEKMRLDDNPKDFIEWIAESKEPVEETFHNVRIDADGDIAQVWFDYSFKRSGYKKNWGKESWQLVRTKDGWKISSVIWSTEMNPVPPLKAAGKP